VWTATGTDELLVETFPGSGVLKNDYHGGDKRIASTLTKLLPIWGRSGGVVMGLTERKMIMKLKGREISRIMACGYMIRGWGGF
jgi:hypothetical protein